MFRGGKADIYEGGHHVPLIVEWPDKALKNAQSSQIVCTTDFFATCADLTGYKIKDGEAEDSYSMLPLITGESDKEIREFTVHHSVNGSFAIRQGDWKLIVAKGSGGWSYPTLYEIKKENLDLPDMQLFDLRKDIGETRNLVDQEPKKAKELLKALKKIILDGRSTPGKKQDNDATEGWKQIEPIVNGI